MLGSIIKPRSWNWAAIGKHPAAKDYIRVGQTSPLIEAVADWAAKGYQYLRPGKEQAQTIHSWRFWLQGAKKGEIICGLGRDSSDCIGRPFPLMVVGEGPLKGWEKNWTELPHRLVKTWERLEHIAARRFDHPGAIEEALAGLKSPGAFEDEEMADGQDAGACECDMDQFQRQMAADGFGLVHLNHGGRHEPERIVRQCHRHLHACCRRMPRGVFVGGHPQQNYLAAISRPLGRTDFVKLWTV